MLLSILPSLRFLVLTLHRHTLRPASRKRLHRRTTSLGLNDQLGIMSVRAGSGPSLSQSDGHSRPAGQLVGAGSIV